jgi:hypothetical protein
MYRQDIKNKIYCDNIKKNNDHALFLRVVKNCNNPMGVSENFAKYRIRKGSISRNKLQMIKPYITVLHDFEHINIPCAYFCLLTHIIIKMFFKYQKINKNRVTK